MGEREPGLTRQLPAASGLASEGVESAGPESELPEATLWVIDDIESGVARLEDPAGRFFELPASWLPLGSAAGDVLRVTVNSTGQGAALALHRDDEEARRRLDEAGDRLERLRKRDPGGNIDL
jgi:hypothetical protein